MNTERIRKILENIIAQRDYSQRIDKLGDDLYDPLIDLINTVLEETQKRGERIELHKKSLKEQVAVCTKDLEKTNQQLAFDKRGAETFSLSKFIILVFTKQDALKAFRNSDGWKAGVDGSVALISLGMGDSLDTTNVKDPIVAFVFGQKGLMYNLTLEGSKLNKLHK